jgi:hypothetical protein
MKDPVIKAKVDELKLLVEQVNQLMSDLQDMSVEVRISYVDPYQYGTGSEPVQQSIKLWKVVEHNGYL